MSDLRIIEILNALADGSKSVAEVSELLSLAPQAMAEVTLDPVSYTHLTLPTILLV